MLAHCWRRSGGSVVRVSQSAGRRSAEHADRGRLRHVLPRAGDRGRDPDGARRRTVSWTAQKAETGEYHALLLFSIAGQCVMVGANDLIMIFIGLEISSIASYILAGYLRDDKRDNEAALKYFLLGSFATAFFLYGVAVDLRHDRDHQPGRDPRAR